MDFLQDKKEHAVGGYLTDHNSCPRCWLIDFGSNSSVVDAMMSAFDAIQFLVEEAGVHMEDIIIKSSSKEMVSWWYQIMYVPWECRFGFNRIQNMKRGLL